MTDRPRSVGVPVLALACTLLAGVPRGAAQPIPPPMPPPGAAPPLLSTAPTTPPGAVPQPGQMSGYPLQVGDLPPGTIVVRIIRGDFSNNVANQAVQVRVGTDAPVQAVTGPDGRAQFDGIRIGAQAQVLATIDGERLDSQTFIVPDRGGVRMVLVTGAGAVPAAGLTMAPPPSVAAAIAPTAGRPASERMVRTVAVVAFFGILTGGSWLMYRSSATRRTPRNAVAARGDAAQDAPVRTAAGTAAIRREMLVDELTRVTEARRRREIGEETFEARRATLVNELERLYLDQRARG